VDCGSIEIRFASKNSAIEMAVWQVATVMRHPHVSDAYLYE